MVLAPDVNSGSYFNDQDRTSRRVEWLTTYGFTPIGPAHLIKIGAGVTHEAFDAAAPIVQWTSSARTAASRGDSRLSGADA